MVPWNAKKIHKLGRPPCNTLWCWNNNIIIYCQHWQYKVINVFYQAISHCWGHKIWTRLGHLIWSFQDGHVKKNSQVGINQSLFDLNYNFLRSLSMFYNICIPHKYNCVHAYWKIAIKNHDFSKGSTWSKCSQWQKKECPFFLHAWGMKDTWFF